MSNLQSTLRGVAGALALVLAAVPSAAQAPQRGPRHVDPRWHALVGATVIPAPGERVEDATIVVRDGMIVSVESGGEPPAGARVHDCTGLFVYAGLIEPYFEVEAPKPEAHGAHWNQLVTPQRSALDGDGLSEDQREELRALGFAAACLSPKGGVFRGHSALVALGEPGTETADETAAVLARDLYQAFAFERAPSNWRRGGPNEIGDPSSEMGAIALARQTLADAIWQAGSLEVYRVSPQHHEPPVVNDALAALGTASSGARLLFDARNELQALRAGRLAAEFRRGLVLLGSGTEYRRLQAVFELGVPVICPLAFPEAPDVATAAEAHGVSLRRLQAWEQAPTNPRRLVDAGVKTVLTTARLEKRKDFWPNLREAIEHGLSEDAALEMLTSGTARMFGLGLDGGLGRVAPGFQAHLLVTDGPLFDEDTEFRDLWVGGRRYELNPAPEPELDGRWTGTFERVDGGDRVEASLELDGTKATVHANATELEARGVQLDAGTLHLLFEGDALGVTGTWTFSGRFEGEDLFGTLIDAAGETLAVRLAHEGSDEADEEDSEDGEESSAVADVPEEVPVPLGAYGTTELPEQVDLVLTGATVWTSADAGVIEDAAVWIQGGIVRWVGPAADLPDVGGAATLDVAGKHVTPGLIDCHSHTGISGAVNEMGQRVTAEVRVADVIDPDDVNWYRQLAGGLTAANQLHGSGNAVGGQNSVVKLRWGVGHPDGMRLLGAKPGIKFALGENPKRVAQGTHVPDEYPQTRMGVATLITDRLLAGREYRQAHERYAALPDEVRGRTMPPRRDLELEALGQITAGERLVHCHSYRQDEILMLCRVAEQLGFKIGTFQHVLEGYKVAEAIAEHALGASTFSDWWAYKFEVIDAIPHNAALMHDVGVVVSVNSDSSDHARRLNTEAAKSVKYGGLEPAEALKLVTLNPAIQLAVEDRVGSLEAGKDADLVVWSGDPLSYRSLCERTFVDGRELYSVERDAELREAARRERQRIIQKLLSEGRPDVVADAEDSDDEEDEAEPGWTSDWRSGAPDGVGLRGDCGCNHLDLGTER